jgi:predicted nicotinamide N-methyase
MSHAPIDLVDEEVDLGHGRIARIARPRAPERLLDAAVACGAEDAPYWAELWPSARALAVHVAAMDLAGRSAVELGCGLGLVSVAAAIGGAEVLAVDHDPDAVELARRNGARVGPGVRGLVADLRDPPATLLAAGTFDLVLAADVLYDRPFADAIAHLVPALTAPGGMALVAFPWRGQADALAAALGAADMDVELTELEAPGVLPVRRVGLLSARTRSDCHE